MFAILVYENNQTVIMLVLQANPLGIEHFHVKTFFCCNKFA